MAIRKGDLKRKPCCICLNAPAQGHHEDYGRPLEVVWLCAPHHRQLHKNPDLLHDIIKWDLTDPEFMAYLLGAPGAAAQTNICEAHP